MSKYGDADVVVDIVIPCVILVLLFVINGIVMFFIMWKRKEALAHAGEEQAVFASDMATAPPLTAENAPMAMATATPTRDVEIGMCPIADTIELDEL